MFPLLVILMSNIMSNKERKKLIQLIKNVNLGNEDQVWNLAVELGKVSVHLRANIVDVVWNFLCYINH